MLKTIMWSGVLLAIVFAGPIGLFHGSNFWNDWQSGKTSSKAASAAATGEKAAADPANPLPAASLPGLNSPPIFALDDVFRFDLAPTNVLQRWPRVSTELPTLHLQGYRVPLVSGTDPTSLAGSLTYYFNPAQQVERITFRGTTGDPHALILLLTNRYRYARRPNNDPSRLVYESVNSDRQLVGQVLIRSVPVVQQNKPFQKYEIDLSMGHPQE
jgi:hypothetical protein